MITITVSGEQGAGKSTLIHAIAIMLTRRGGTIIRGRLTKQQKLNATTLCKTDKLAVVNIIERQTKDS